MTKDQAYSKLMERYRDGDKFSSFFHKVIDDFAGCSDIIDTECFQQIIRYLNNMT